ncbi:peptidase U32 family protein [Caviibacter abscessus]|uniref:peptidase U32 family protein n=1 Tax=Caviibacter abscessus TaxID=1766719 RepID=UPI000837014E|nr:U32 family peptidase [Caviibacter abscessus]
MDIVAPAGNYEKLVAAIKAGANEVYLGLKGFGARRNNDNLGYQELFDGIDYAHSRGVKCLLTLNTVLKDVELKNVINAFIPIYKHGIDAVIVQDIGLMSVLQENFPDLIIHGSTQTTVSNHIEANYFKELGLKRVVLARELSFNEIKEIREKTDIELEVFVSGAMCISYSGNCYISSFIGGRSGNRGMCAYTCRKKFKQDYNKIKYTLSPNDQFLENKEIEMLESIGIDSIKIEGRKKNQNYVFETVGYYRSVIDKNPRPSMSYKLFNRGYSKGYFYLDDNLMNTKYPSNFGYLLGSISNNKIKLLDDLENGDGIQYVNSNFETIEGIFVNKIFKNDKKVVAAFKNDIISLPNIPKNAVYIYKNYSKALNDKIEHDIKISKRYLNIDIILKAEKNNNISLTFCTKNLKNELIEVNIKGSILNELSKKSISLDMISEKLSELGDTTFKAQNINIHYNDGVFISFSELKNLKRQAASLLYEKLINSYRRNEDIYVNYKQYDKNIENKPYVISALVENEEQEKACIEMGITKIYKNGKDVAKQKNLNKLTKATNLAYNFYDLLKNEKLENKYSINWNLNIFNNYSIDALSKFKNVDTIFLSPELSYKQIRHITTKSLKKGLVIYGYLKGMYIEHSIIEKNYMEIQGEFYDRYKLRKNEFGNVELFLNKPMNLIPKLYLIETLGLDELRLDFVFETYEETKKIIKSIKTKSGTYNPYTFQMGVS